ncbi:uncharacterized protein LOC108908652 isoform X2 [Anoplophora glabripennis]|uniref:uncharacterized protein LOC108908652 isoform X2 n=1 Tax=Anoplophora glabripennis TaxID=217634 RepID=UPI0008750DE1|nr:uncharacterized protein LOC108908652 isoform X2 [Anoplophora glabripennis]
MGESKENICRLCLNIEDSNFTKLDASAIGKIKAIVPELILNFPNDFVICSKCRNVLEKSFDLKRMVSKNNELIQNERDKSKSNKVNLHNIVKSGNSKSCRDICRICLQPIEGKFVYINKDVDDDFSNVLDYCIPELDETLSLKPAVCSTCQILLYKLYNYKKDWLSVEERIQTSPDCVTDKGVDLNKILMLNRTEEENDFLSGFEVKDEDETDIFDEIPNIREESKRPISEVVKEEETPPIKKQKLMIGNINDEELPHFHFNNNLLYNPNKTDIVEDWLAQVEEYKQKFNWSDYTTIHKVLVKLKDLKELYIWFSNIADIMDWKQWKTKLTRAFPRRNDYHIYLKKLITRRKKKEETYVAYYNDKLKLMEPLNLTAEQKISCIFGGITDILVCCVGRVGDYKSPEELLDYFKSCDDKETVEAAAQINKEALKPVPRSQRLRARGQIKPVTNLVPVPKDKSNIHTKCGDCHRYGHSVIECRQYKIGEHLDKVDKLKPQNNPRASDARARKPKKMKPNVDCFLCGQPGHFQNACKLYVPLNTPKAPQKKQSPKKPKERFEERCSFCRKEGHTIDNCWSHKRGKPNSPRIPKQNKNVDSTYSRCSGCGQFGSITNPCCPASIDKYLGAYIPENNDFNQICLRCYKPGHLTKDCDQFSRRSYRN